MKTPRIAAGILLGTLLNACGPHTVKAPQEQPDSTVVETQPSIIAARLNIPTHQITGLLLAELPDPLVQGTSPEINAKILAAEQITTQEMIEEIVSPYVPGHWKREYRERVEHYKEAFDCLIKPWKWGKCYKDMTRVVLDPFDVWVDPVQAVTRRYSKDITKILDKVYGIGVTVDYKAQLQSQKIWFEDQDVHLDTIIRVHLKFNYDQNAIPLTDMLKLKGSLAGHIDFRIQTQGNLVIADGPKLEIKVPEDKVKITVAELAAPGAVELIQLETLAKPWILPCIPLIQKEISKQAAKLINKEINKNEDKLDFREHLEKLGAKIGAPLDLNNDFWLQPQVQSVLLSQIKGSGGPGADNHLSVMCGIEAKPMVIYSATPPKPSEIKLTAKVGTYEEGVRLFPEFVFEYQKIADSLKTGLNDYLKTKQPDIPFSIGQARLYPSNGKIVAAIVLQERDGRRVVELYLWGQPIVNTEKGEVTVEQFAFTVDSQNWLAKNLVALSQTSVATLVQKSIQYSYRNDLEKWTAKVAKFEQETGFGKISGRFEDVAVLGVSLSKTGFVVRARAQGTIRVEDLNIEPKQDVGSTLAPMTSHLSMSDATKGGAFPLALNEPVTKSVAKAGVVALSAIQAALSDTNKNLKADAPPVSPFSPSEFIVKPGDTIYYVDQDGKTQNRIATTKDASYIGKKIYVRSKDVVYPITLDQ